MPGQADFGIMVGGSPLALLVMVVTFAFAMGAGITSTMGGSRRLLRALPCDKRRGVCITGCDSGFGLLAASALGEAGYTVFAACLTAEGCARLRPHVAVAVQCDVTNSDDIARLAAEVTRYLNDGSTACLWAVINNAGVAPLSYVDWTTMESFRFAMDVNFFGAVAVTKALLPLLKRTRGSRIINVSSVAGLGAGPMFAAYAASKHAVEGYTKCLRLELRPWGIHVANINPGFMRTPMIEGAAVPTLAAFRAAPAEVRAQYPDAENMLSRMHESVLAVGEDPQVVVNQMLRLLRARWPALVNLTGFQAVFLGNVFFAMPGRLQDFLSGIFVEVSAPQPDVMHRLQSGSSNGKPT